MLCCTTVLFYTDFELNMWLCGDRVSMPTDYTNTLELVYYTQYCALL